MYPDYRQFMHLLAIARCGSFSGAATLLRMSQPALSNSISQLESRLKTRVLDRGRSGARLTDAGQALARHAEILETQMERALEEVRFRRMSQLGPLNVGVTPVAAASLVPRALALLKKEMPMLAARVIETVFHEGMPALLKGSLDVMVGPIGVYAPFDGIEEQQLTFDPFSVIVREDHPLASRRSLSLRQLAEVEWVLPSDQSAFHRQLEALFVVAGLTWPQRAIVTNSMAAMKSIAMHSDCVAIMPKQLVTIEQKAGLLRAIRLTEAGASRALGISWAKERRLSEPAAAFVSALQECVRSSRRQEPRIG
ncbi:LysR family transcriptional regulator [Pseudorhodoplanes sp.]|uniref:LysR family transcriptional regulator n=1 Tax=Pseudorhodoplanes sp. TaxID=1934341 RepID=UPI00391AAF60